MGTFNNIGIDGKLDWQRIRKLMIIGLLAGVMVFIGDMILGCGVYDDSLTGIERTLAQKAAKTDSQLFWAAFLGLIGIPLEGLSYFSIYRLMAERSPKHAHSYRSGILGILMFGGCGVHVACIAAVYFYKYLTLAGDADALEKTIDFAKYFLLPATIIFLIFFFVLVITQISAFAKGLTPYPKYCWIFSLLFGIVFMAILKLFGNHALINGLSTAWISIGNLWMYGGLLIMMKKARTQ